MFVTVPLLLVSRMFDNPETPATYSGNAVTPLGIFVRFVAWAVMVLTQWIPCYYVRRYNQTQQDSPGEAIFGLSPSAFLILGSCIGIVTIMTLPR
jgi:hypothetical protein